MQNGLINSATNRKKLVVAPLVGADKPGMNCLLQNA